MQYEKLLARVMTLEQNAKLSKSPLNSNQKPMQTEEFLVGIDEERTPSKFKLIGATAQSIRKLMIESNYKTQANLLK